MRRHRAFLAATIALLVGGTACASDGDDAAPKDSDAATVSIDGNAYGPDTLRVPMGSTVEWANDDSATHTVTADDDTFASEELAADATFEHPFTAKGEFAYYCEIHPFMHGTVVVV